MNLKDGAKPGLMISNVEPESRKEQGRTLEVLKEAMGLDFFEAYQTVEVPYAAERLQIAKHAKANNLAMTYCLARVLNENKLDLCSLDEQLRKTSIEKLTGHFEDAVQQGCSVVQVISGPAEADPNQRLQQLRRFEQSWLELCEAARKYNLTVIVEPLDTYAHKKKAVGLTSEAVEMARNLAGKVDNAFLCLDTSHMILNGEDVVSSVRTAMDYMDELHICNPVVNSDSELFGDRHIKFGAPGVLDIQAVGSLVAECRRMGFFSVSRRPKLFLEVRNANDRVSDLIRYCMQALLEAWEIARGELEE
ncbi:MAG: sugar phosphate isomerase/epimerase family protein [Planctomycetota bacterium]|jgi:sugar phosphate isomerase/epimerase